LAVSNGGRRRSGKGLVVAHPGPELAGAALALGEDGDGGLIGVDALGEHMRLDGVDHELARRRGGPIQSASVET
jgi:hypothetical protein